jgi:enediyne polyketide synthase
MTRIAMVGMGCLYPDAASPRELWENALSGRRAFRLLPDVRMRLEDYWDADPKAPDRFYARNAAVIEGYEFDRIAYKIAGSTFRSTDLTHWLALDVAARALADAGFPMAEGLPRERTGVIIGNSLTGEFSRANILRVRWPFVRRMVAGALEKEGWDAERLATFLDDFEVTYKSPFPEIDEDTLAGALSNTIAGRICNHFDLKGGGYTVDGACSSSLLSVATAARALINGDLDVAVAGGVDISIDPFEIVGFAKTGALATGEMRVFDRSSNGFWPGEGCGMVVLMREVDAVEAGHRIYATVAGWGISSDGSGGITRPEIAGYSLALSRAYEKAGFGIDTVGLFEGHGTGTKVGDATELGALSAARRAAAGPGAPPAAIGSIKGMIGHTKAAAGVAGLIKAALAVHQEVLPPSIGCVDPHELLTTGSPALRTLRRAESWPASVPVRAGVTAMGFGGINTHVVLDSPRRRRRAMRLDTRTRSLAASVQDVELLLVDAATPGELAQRLGRLVDFVPGIAYAQLADLAVTLHGELRDLPCRAAIVAGSPAEAQQRLAMALEAVEAGRTTMATADGRVRLGRVTRPGRVGFLFPGQGSGRGVTGGALRRRFAEAEEAYQRAGLPTGGDVVATEVAQPRIVTGSMAGLRVLCALGIDAAVAVGHSLGEIAALHWSGALDEDDLLRLAAERGRAMAEHSASGTMATIGAGADEVQRLTAGLPVVVAGHNGPRHTVVAGTTDAVEAACRLARNGGLDARRLAVSHAFHSPLVAPAADAFAGVVRAEAFAPLERRIVSTVTGEVLPADVDIPALLHRQITDPVLFRQAVSRAAQGVDLFVEVGPGRVLANLAATSTEVPVVSLDTDDESLASLLTVVAAAYVTGAVARAEALFHGRFARPLQVGTEFAFFENPCESAPALATARSATHTAATHTAAARAAAAAARPFTATRAPAGGAAAAPTAETSEDMLRQLVAQRAELPLVLVRSDSRLLDDLHFSSITVGQVVNELAERMNVPAAHAPTNFAMATVRELAEALDSIAATVGDAGSAAAPVVAGAAPWTRAWRIDLDEARPAARVATEEDGEWHVYAPQDHPLAPSLTDALRRARVGGGVLVCLPKNAGEDDLWPAFAGAKQALSGEPGSRFVLVGHGRGAAGMARTLRLEAPRLRVTVLDLPFGPEAADRVVAEVSATATFAEVRYDASGTRRIPVLRAMPVRAARTVRPLGASDVLLVTGGGKGITAECALAMAADAGARLAVLGRSDPARDTELAANLGRMAAAGVAVRYASADVTDPAQVRRAVDELTGHLGPVTAVLHGAGRNEPVGIGDLEPDALRATLAPKVGGLRAVLDAVDPERLRLLVTLGSIIGRAGLRGEAHYATANDQLAELTAEFGRRYPQCRSICLEWSVWSGVGMGERLSVVESLNRDGVTPVTPDQGIAVLRRLLADPDTPGTVVVSGRTGDLDTLRYDLPTLPLLRFAERPVVRYHGAELVTEAELSAATDPYLADHLLDGNLLFPAVFGMEAMGQVASALTGAATVPVFENVEFLRPIVVTPHGSTRIRIAATLIDDNLVEVAIRSEETSFAADHFTARLRLGDAEVPDGPPDQVAEGIAPVTLDPKDDLYSGLLFQGGRFQRLRRYHRAAARYVDAEVAAIESVDWFARFMPGALLLGDPGVRDALMHGNQVCVPDATLLPVGVDRIHAGGGKMFAAHGLRYCAVERSRDGDTYVYDIALRTDGGEVLERWEGLRLRAVRKQDGRGPWVAPLLGPYLERALGDLVGGQVAVVVEPDGAGEPRGDHVARRRVRTRIAAGRAFGRPVEVGYRPDGRPEVPGERGVSAAHGAGLTLFVAARGALGCDVEPVVARSADAWQGLLGAHAELARLTAEATGEGPDAAATRVWAARECLQKAGIPPGGPLTLRPVERDGWAVFTVGPAVVATFATTLRGMAGPVVFAVLTEGRR